MSRWFLTLVSFLFLAIGIWFLFNYDFYAFNRLMRTLDEKGFLKKELAKEKAKLKKVKGIFESYKAFLETKETISLALPEKPDLGQVLYELDGLAKLSGVILKGCSFSEVGGGRRESRTMPREVLAEEGLRKGYKTLSVAIEVEGSYEAIKDFFKKIETNMRIMDIKRVSLASSLKEEKEGGEREETLKANIKIHFYYQLE